MAAAIRSAEEYKKMDRRPGEAEVLYEARLDEAWDAMLTPIDEYLERRQASHLRGVDAAGASGRA